MQRSESAPGAAAGAGAGQQRSLQLWPLPLAQPDQAACQQPDRIRQAVPVLHHIGRWWAACLRRPGCPGRRRQRWWWSLAGSCGAPAWVRSTPRYVAEAPDCRLRAGCAATGSSGGDSRLLAVRFSGCATKDFKMQRNAQIGRHDRLGKRCPVEPPSGAAAAVRGGIRSTTLLACCAATPTSYFTHVSYSCCGASDSQKGWVVSAFKAMAGEGGSKGAGSSDRNRMTNGRATK